VEERAMSSEKEPQRPKGTMGRMVKFILERYGYPGELNQRRNPPSYRVKGIRWELERFAEIVAWDDYVARQVIEGSAPLHFSMMVMRQETKQYEGELGGILYDADVWIQQQIDPSVDVSR
jgi:hypothetical protein